ncbi:MAG: protein kinase [Tabrizicola sp.]|jgi:tRNA A-37 threonylcarbamoyl transferase component Bud32|nr:protein kinase [Tabrizicola sp.]
MKSSAENNQIQGSQGEMGDELPSGTQLSNGNYTIQRHLKTGGFGITYLAHDTLGRPVVIKECFPGTLCSRASKQVQLRSRAHSTSVESLVQRFVVEAHSQAKLDHPNVVKVHQVFKENNTAYMAMDYVQGHDLLETIRQPDLTLTPTEVRSSLLKLLDAVAAVHDQNLLHRDISPDNILIDGKRRPILIDFGAAKDEAARIDSVASTLHVVKDGYSPQELYLSGGGNQGPWSDLYALAATYYHVISGSAPPNSQVRLAAMAANTADPCVPLSGRFDAYEPRFLAALDKTMAVLPKERFQSARQWINAINGSEDGNVRIFPVSEVVRQVTPMTRVTRAEAQAARKKIGPIALLGGVGVVALVGLGIFLALPSGDDVQTGTASNVGKALAAGSATVEAEPAVAPEPTPVADPAPPSEPASAEPVAEAVAPPPVVEATAADPGVTEVSALTSNWTVELPFSAGGNEPTRVQQTTGASPDWLVPGLLITAVNGTPVTRINDIPGILRESVSPGDQPTISVTLTTLPEGSTDPVDQTLDLPVMHRIMLRSGAQFLVEWQESAWRTEVFALPDGYSGEVKVGDIVVAHVNSGVRVDRPNALSEALLNDILSKAGSTRLAIEQNGQIWIVSFPLPR